MFDLLRFVWDLNAFKQVFIDAQLDVIKLPLGVLTHERINKSNTILGEASRVLLKAGTLNATYERQISDLTEVFY